jgi:dipeptidyl aminopeptidase/acylaminoacyl peptidase
MVFFSRGQKNQSLFGFAKNFAGACKVVAATVVLSGCASSSKSGGASPQSGQNNSATTLVAPYGELLTKIGENESPSWSPDGQILVFISKNRSSHKNAQAYELDLSSSKERRITYSDGDVSTPVFVLNGQKIVYASTTDELKESPVLLRKNSTSPSDLAAPPTELYLSDLSGIQILRLTDHPGFDGLPFPSSVRENEVFYYSIFDERSGGNSAALSSPSRPALKLLKMNISSKKSDSVFRQSPTQPQWDWAFLNSRLAWVQLDKSAPSNSSQLWIGTGAIKNAKAIDGLAGTFRDLQWIEGAKTGDEKLMMTQKIDEQSFSRTVIYDPQMNCLKVILVGPNFNISQARLSPDRRRIAFVSDQVGGTPQVFSKWVTASELECDTHP